MRGAIRQVDFDGLYRVYLYSLDQAEALAEYLRAEAIADDIELVPIHEAGIMDVERPKPGRPKKIEPVDERTFAERQEARRASDRERKRRWRAEKRQAEAAAGTLRPRGRPWKAS